MRATTRTQGFGLIEMMVALALTSVLLVIVFGTFYRSQRAAARVSQLIENRQNTRTALQLLSRDLRMAGSGWGHVTVEGCYNGSPLSITAFTPGYGQSDAASDTIGMLGAWDAATTLRSAMATTSSTILVVSASGFAVNDLCVVTDGTTAHMFQITSISTNDISHANSSKYNKTGGHLNWPTSGYKIGANVYRASWVSYFRDSTGQRPSLKRWEENDTPQVVAYDVGQFKVSYVLDGSAGDSLVRDPDDLTLVNRIQPVLFTSAKSQGKASLPDSAWASIKPRSF